MAASGKRGELIAVLPENVATMPGCRSDVVAADPADCTTIQVTEVRDSEVERKASLALPAVSNAIARARPFIA